MEYTLTYHGESISVSHDSGAPEDIAAAIMQKLPSLSADEHTKVLYNIYKDCGHEMQVWPNRADRIASLKADLTATDYIALKAYEGQDCTQYGDWRADRQALRDEINRLEALTDDEWADENRAALAID